MRSVATSFTPHLHRSFGVFGVRVAQNNHSFLCLAHDLAIVAWRIVESRNKSLTASVTGRQLSNSSFKIQDLSWSRIEGPKVRIYSVEFFSAYHLRCLSLSGSDRVD